MELNFYNKYSIKNINITFPDIYFTPEYGEACEFSDNAEWECCIYNDLIYVYLKKSIIYNDITYYELITPYGYSGYYYKIKNTFESFLPLFRKEAYNKNYIIEILRQNPYLNIEINNYDIIKDKSIYGIEITYFDDYYNNSLNSNIKNMYTKAEKNNLRFKLFKLSNNYLQDNFYPLYFENMKKVNALPYYYFNKDYFNYLEKINNIFLACILNINNEIIGSSIIIFYNNFIHYHLSCNNKTLNCITEFLLINIIKEFGVNKLFILGGGLNNDDNLSKFKKKFSNREYKYNIYKYILNNEIYNKIKNINL